ncbi:MAG TPA: hypothetical protein VMY18_06110, partial [Acidobacteriota bacterium]|nr:hypothetical protein [Acidobacteriota bacterium]
EAYVSPPIAIFALTGLFYRAKSRYFTLVLVFLLQFIVYIAFLQWLIPYQYYYARYLLTEVVPFSILVAMAGLLAWWARPLGRKAAALLLVTAVGYCLFYTVPQWRGREAEGAYTALAEIARPLNGNDLVFIKRGSFQQQTQIRTPFIYLFDKRVVMYDNASTIESYVHEDRQAVGPFRDFFLLSPWQIESSNLELASETVYREGHFERIQLIPRKFSDDFEFPLFLYKIRKEGFGKGELEE